MKCRNSFTVETAKYLSSLKMMKKTIQKAVESLRGMKNEFMNKENDIYA